MIDCAAFEALLDRLIAGELSPVEERDASRHLHSCEECRELFAIANGESDPLTPAAAYDLTDAILLQTSGGACAAAEPLLCDWVDQTLPEIDAKLLSLHLDRCVPCRMLAEALAAMRLDLPQMAEIRPDPLFVRDVLAATIERDPRRTARRAVRNPRADSDPLSLGGLWDRLVRRPRLALELAYSGAMLIFLLAGTPISPLKGIPGRALAIVQSSPVETIRNAWDSGPDLTTHAEAVGRTAWGKTGPPVAKAATGFWSVCRRQFSAAVDLISFVEESGGKVLGAIWRGDLVEAGRVLGEAREVKRDRNTRRGGIDGNGDRTPEQDTP